MSLVTSRQERVRFLRFMVVGTIGAAVDFGTFNLLTLVVNVLPLLSSMLSFSAAIISNFLWNRYWTYPDSRSKPIAGQLVQFALVNVVGLAIRTPLFAFLEEPLSRFFETLDHAIKFSPEFLGHNTALAIAVGVVMLWNFFVNRYWTYNDINKSS